MYGTVKEATLEGERLVFASTNHGSSTLTRSMLLRHPKIQIRSDLEDTHIYLMKRWVPEFLVAFTHEEGDLEEIVGIQDALLPFLASNQHTHKLKEFALKHPGGQSTGMMQFLGNFRGEIAVDSEMMASVNEMLGYANSVSDDAVKVIGVIEDPSKSKQGKLLRRVGLSVKAYLDTNTMALQ